MKYKLLMLVSLFLTGCVGDQSIYYWNGYQESVYQILKLPDANPTEQIIALQEVMKMARAESKPMPPGLYANLGMLYAKEGNLEAAKANFMWEKSLFPESAGYMNFLINSIEARENKHD